MFESIIIFGGGGHHLQPPLPLLDVAQSLYTHYLAGIKSWQVHRVSVSLSVPGTKQRERHEVLWPVDWSHQGHSELPGPSSFFALRFAVEDREADLSGAYLLPNALMPTPD